MDGSRGLRKVQERKRARIHQRRLRRPCSGELVQIDGSPHDWFEGWAPRCTLIVLIDEATGRLVKALRLRGLSDIDAPMPSCPHSGPPTMPASAVPARTLRTPRQPLPHTSTELAPILCLARRVRDGLCGLRRIEVRMMPIPSRATSAAMAASFLAKGKRVAAIVRVKCLALLWGLTIRPTARPIRSRELSPSGLVAIIALGLPPLRACRADPGGSFVSLAKREHGHQPPNPTPGTDLGLLFPRPPGRSLRNDLHPCDGPHRPPHAAPCFAHLP